MISGFVATFVALVLVFGIILTIGWEPPFIGTLPGDMHTQIGPLTVYFPLTTSLLFSLIVTVVMSLFPRR